MPEGPENISNVIEDYNLVLHGIYNSHIIVNYEVKVKELPHNLTCIIRSILTHQIWSKVIHQMRIILTHPNFGKTRELNRSVMQKSGAK